MIARPIISILENYDDACRADNADAALVHAFYGEIAELIAEHGWPELHPRDFNVQKDPSSANYFVGLLGAMDLGYLIYPEHPDADWYVELPFSLCRPTPEYPHGTLARRVKVYPEVGQMAVPVLIDRFHTVRFPNDSAVSRSARKGLTGTW